jgi:uncharacterized protein YgbK (DUF1537 family)
MTVQQVESIAAGRQQQKTDDQAIELLAKETHVAIDQVRSLYEAEHARLASQARVKTYLSVIATRLVRTALQESPRSAIQ